MPSIEVQGLSMEYRTKLGVSKILSDVTFTVQDGEIVSIIGPSGSGKTTLILMLAYLRKPTAGSILIDGREVSKVPDVGVIFQEFNRALLLWKDVLANVEMGAELAGLPPAERRRVAHKFVEMVGLKDFERYLPGQLSGGMKQRVQIARVLAYDPAFLLCDEPFGSLDAQTRTQLQRDFLLLCQESKKTIIFVTHDVDEAITVADRVLVLSSLPGHVIAEFSVDLPRPRLPFHQQDPDVASRFNDIRAGIWKLLGL